LVKRKSFNRCRGVTIASCAHYEQESRPNPPAPMAAGARNRAPRWFDTGNEIGHSAVTAADFVTIWLNRLQSCWAMGPGRRAPGLPAFRQGTDQAAADHSTSMSAWGGIPHANAPSMNPNCGLVSPSAGPLASQNSSRSPHHTNTSKQPVVLPACRICCNSSCLSDGMDMCSDLRDQPLGMVCR